MPSNYLTSVDSAHFYPNNLLVKAPVQEIAD